MKAPDSHRVGVISDTHGLVRPEALYALRGVERIVHAGDVGTPEVLRILGTVAPVTAVRGNMDRGPWALRLPTTEAVEAGNALLYVLHDLEELDLDPAAGGFRVVITGHSHRPAVFERSGVLYLNPGSAGPRRFALPTSVALLEVNGASVEATIVELVAG